MTATASQPSIKAIAQSTGVWNRNIERAAWLEYPADLPQRTLQIQSHHKAGKPCRIKGATSAAEIKYDAPR